MALSKKNFKEIIQFATDFRHNLHKNPELTWDEVDTAKAIRDILDAHGIAYKTYAKTGTVGLLAQDKKGLHVALRSDIDALPLQEKTDVVYKSQKPKCMHACGHDGHTATLIAVSLWLKQNEDSLENPVSLVFQPAEEGGHGAKKMIDEGCLDGVDVIYGWHNWPAIKFGQAVCPDGTVMAGNGTFHIKVIGVGGHSSQPELCRDPVLAASAITLNLQQIISRQISPQDSAVVSVTSIDGVSDLTTIPDSVKVEGTIRVPNEEIKWRVFNKIKQVSEDTAKSYGVKAEVELRDRYGATINHDVPAQTMRNTLKDVLGDDWKSDLPTPIMASEDFSYYLNTIPGCFALIGSDDGVEKHQKPCHNVYYDFNDKLIEPVSKALMKLANYNGEF